MESQQLSSPSSFSLGTIKFIPVACISSHRFPQTFGQVVVAAGSLRMLASCHNTSSLTLELLSPCCGSDILLGQFFDEKEYYCGHCKKSTVAASMCIRLFYDGADEGHRRILRSWVDTALDHEVERALFTMELAHRLEAWTDQVKRTRVVRRRVQFPLTWGKPKLTRKFVKLCQQASGEL